MTTASRPSKRSEPDFSLLKRVVEATPEPEPLKFRHGQVLSFDQSLNATGFVVVQGPELEILDAGLISGTSSSKGHEGNLSKATSIFLAVQMVLDRWPDAELIHETPPIGGARMMRPESSLLSASSIRNAAILKNRKFISVSAQTAKKFVCGSANADKKEAHRALAERWGHLVGYEKLTNEHKRDAMLIAITHLRED